MYKVALIEDAAITVEGVALLFETFQNYQLTATYNNNAEFFDDFENISIDLLLVDIDKPISEGSALIHKILNLAPDLKIIVLSHHYSNEIMQAIGGFGAHGFMEKPLCDDCLQPILDRVMAGETAFPEQGNCC